MLELSWDNLKFDWHVLPEVTPCDHKWRHVTGSETGKRRHVTGSETGSDVAWPEMKQAVTSRNRKWNRKWRHVTESDVMWKRPAILVLNCVKFVWNLSELCEIWVNCVKFVWKMCEIREKLFRNSWKFC